MKGSNVALSAAFALALAGLAASATATAAPKEYWKGRPDFAAGEVKGYFIWQDEDGWHARWTSKGEKGRTFSGTITCDGEFMKFEAVKKDERDLIKKDSATKIRFDTVTHGGVDGLDFRVSASTQKITFDLKIEGSPAPTQEVRLGAKKERPASMPFTIDRGGR